MITEREIAELNALFPDAIGDCPYCLDDVDVHFIVSYKLGTNEKDLYFQIVTANHKRETWKWGRQGWREVFANFLEYRISRVG